MIAAFIRKRSGEHKFIINISARRMIAARFLDEVHESYIIYINYDCRVFRLGCRRRASRVSQVGKKPQRLVAFAAADGIASDHDSCSWNSARSE